MINLGDTTFPAPGRTASGKVQNETRARAFRGTRGKRKTTEEGESKQEEMADPPQAMSRAERYKAREEKQKEQPTALQKIGSAAKTHLLQGAFNMLKKPTSGIQGTHDTGDGVTAGMPNWKMGTDVMRQASLVRDYNIPGIAHQWASRVVHHLPKSM